MKTHICYAWRETLLPDNKCGEFPAQHRTGSLNVSGKLSIWGVSYVLMV